MKGFFRYGDVIFWGMRRVTERVDSNGEDEVTRGLISRFEEHIQYLSLLLCKYALPIGFGPASLVQ
jgi:hypothetical protein